MPGFGAAGYRSPLESGDVRLDAEQSGEEAVEVVDVEKYQAEEQGDKDENQAGDETRDSGDGVKNARDAALLEGIAAVRARLLCSEAPHIQGSGGAASHRACCIAWRDAGTSMDEVSMSAGSSPI